MGIRGDVRYHNAELRCIGCSHAPPQPNVSHGTSYRYVPCQLRNIHTICCDLLRPIRVIWHTRFPSLVSVSKMGHIHVALSSTELVRAPRISPLVAFMSEWSIVLCPSPIRNQHLLSVPSAQLINNPLSSAVHVLFVFVFRLYHVHVLRFTCTCTTRYCSLLIVAH